MPPSDVHPLQDVPFHVLVHNALSVPRTKTSILDEPHEVTAGPEAKPPPYDCQYWYWSPIEKALLPPKLTTVTSTSCPGDCAGTVAVKVVSLTTLNAGAAIAPK
jgi:hypothetical protein